VIVVVCNTECVLAHVFEGPKWESDVASEASLESATNGRVFREETETESGGREEARKEVRHR
jgi:hypothetical protein